MRRFNGELLFNKTFNEYETGFGDIGGEHWLGKVFISVRQHKIRPSEL